MSGFAGAAVLSRFRDQFPQRDEHGAEILRLLLRVVQAMEQPGQLPGRYFLAVGDRVRQAVDAVLQPEALRLQLEGPRIALREGRLDLVSRQAGALRARVEERADPMHEVEMVGRHGEPIMFRRKAGVLWATRPIFSAEGPSLT